MRLDDAEPVSSIVHQQLQHLAALPPDLLPDPDPIQTWRDLFPLLPSPTPLLTPNP